MRTWLIFLVVGGGGLEVENATYITANDAEELVLAYIDDSGWSVSVQ